MNTIIVDAFSGALEAVLRESGFERVRIRPEERPTDLSNATFEVSVSVGIAGGIKGFLLLLGKSTAARDHAVALSNYFGVQLDAPDDFGSMHKAALAELVNQISGRATMLLSDLGIDADITPPTIITGDDISTNIPSGLTLIELGIHSSVGEMTAMVEYQTG